MRLFTTTSCDHQARHLSVQQFFIISVALLLNGCSLWSDHLQVPRLSVKVNENASPTSRSSWLQHQVSAMDAVAFDVQRTGSILKLSCQLTLTPRKT